MNEMVSFINLRSLAMTKYVVFVNEFNPNSNDSVSYEEELDSLIDVVHYTKPLYDMQHVHARVEKWTKHEGEDSFVSEVIMRF